MNPVILSLVLLVTVLASSNAENITQDSDPRIVNGVDVGPNEILYQVSVQRNGGHFCGGSVISRNYVLTAAHCLERFTPNMVRIVAGTKNLNNPYSVHQAVRIVMHPQYNPSNIWINDIALIKVREPFAIGPRIQIGVLPQRNQLVPDNAPAVVSGWGRLIENGPSTMICKKVTLYITNQQTCRRIYGILYDQQICASDPRAMKGSCQGDSGGPLTVNGVIVGIVSWARGCGLRNFPSVYARVTSYIDWIHSNAV